MIESIEHAANLADVIELRFDCIREADVNDLLKNLPQVGKTYLFTFRPKDQGGKRDSTLSERLKFWERVFASGQNDFIIDLEFDPKLLSAVNPSKTERIVSFHDFGATQNDLDPQLGMMAELSGVTIKIATCANDATDALPMWRLLDSAKAYRKKIIPIAMGEAGKWTRILGLAHGSFMAYASPSVGQETADGQITAKDLVEVYRVKELDLDTKVYGVIGHPVSESLSPYIHNPAFAATGINAVFIPLQVKNLDEFIRRMVSPETREVELNFGGFAVTMPHKQAIIKHLDAIDPTAEKIGAVNTVKIDEGKLTGYNTDAYGFITPLKERFGDLKGSRVAVFGAGGAARACVFALKQESANVTVFARDNIKAEQIADEFQVRSEQLTTDNRPLTADVDIVVNATPLGMKGKHENETPLSAADLTGVKFIYDLVTARTDTPLIRAGKEANVPAIGGLEMLIAQAVKQFEIWTGHNAPLDVMRNSVEEKMR